jgi:hypothetical protein
MQDIIMIPWKSLYAEQSVRFFAQKNFALLPSSQGVTEEGHSEAPKWTHYIREYYAEKDLPTGLIHCNWGYEFNLERTWRHLRTVADHAWSVAPYLIHKPVATADKDSEVELFVRVEGDSVSYDGRKTVGEPLPVKKVSLFYRYTSGAAFQESVMHRHEDGFLTTIKAVSDDIEYYISARDTYNSSTIPASAPQNLFKIELY